MADDLSGQINSIKAGLAQKELDVKNKEREQVKIKDTLEKTRREEAKLESDLNKVTGDINREKGEIASAKNQLGGLR